MNKSYFLLSREIFESAIWRENPDLLKLFIWIIGNARYNPEPKKYPGFEVKRGELITSWVEIAKANESVVNRSLIRWSNHKVSDLLNRLEESGYISRTKDTFGTHIIVCNYDTYQNPESYLGIDKGQTRDRQGIDKGQTGDRQGTDKGHNSNNGKQVKQDNQVNLGEINTPYPQGDMMVLPEIKKSKTNDIPPISKTPRRDTSPFPLPEWIQPTDWIDYVEMRIAIKKPMTRRAMELAVIKLSELAKAGHMPKDVLRQSILNNWQGLFPIKTMTGPSGSVYQKSVPASLQVSPNKYDNLANEVVATMRDKIKDIQ